MNNKVFLLIGGNLGDRFALLDQAKMEISEQIGHIIKESSIYESAPWGFESENDFLNQVLIVTTDLKPQEVLKKCLAIENQLGRVRNSDHYTSRTMDIDILFYNDLIINEPDLIIPHPKLHERRFTLEPLNEIAGEFKHPVIKKSIQEISKNCIDKSEVKKL